MKIGVLSSKAGWHFQDLQRAAKQIAGLEVQAIDFRQLSALVHDGKESVSPGDDSASPDALLVRIMPAGSLQQVVFRMDSLQRMAAGGLPVVNPPRAMEIAIDKYLSLCLIAQAGISVPCFEVTQTVPSGLKAWKRLGGDVVLKPIFGSMGRDLVRISDPDIAVGTMEDFVQRGEVLYLQRFVDHGGFDIRAFVIEDLVFGMKRTAGKADWRTNATCGGVCTPHQLTDREKEIAIRAAKANQCAIAGVDLVYDRRNSAAGPLVLEVNAAPGWQSLSAVCEIDIAARVLEFIRYFADRN